MIGPNVRRAASVRSERRTPDATRSPSASSTARVVALAVLVSIVLAFSTPTVAPVADGLDAAVTTVEDETPAPVTLGVDVETTVEDVTLVVADGKGAVGDLVPTEQAPGIVLLAGYERRDSDEVLDNDVRERLYHLVAETPGESIAGLTRASDVERSTVRYHVRVLERAGLVESRSLLGHHRVYPATTDDDAAVVAAALATRSTERVVRAVERLEPVGVTDLGAELDLATSTVSHHVDRLTDAGLLTRHRDGRTVAVRLASGVRENLP